MRTTNAPDAGDETTRFPLFAIAAAQAGDAGPHPPPPAEAPETLDRYADIFERYLALAARDEKEARYWTPERLRLLAATVERWVAELDYERLLALRFRKVNPFSREIFTRLTGIALPKLQADCLQVIDQFVGAGRVAEYHAAKKREAEARDLRHVADRLSRYHTNFEDRTIPMTEFLDLVIGRGYTRLSAAKRGAATEYRLANAAGVFYRLRRRDQHDYARMKVAQLAGAAEGVDSVPEGGGEEAH